MGSSGGPDGKDSSCNAGDPGLIHGLRRSPGEVNGYSLQYSCLENSMDRGALWATVHGVAKSWTRLSKCTHTQRCFQKALKHLMNTFLVVQTVKNLSAMQETQVWSMSWEDPLEKWMVAHSSILAWRILWTEEPGGLLSMGLQRFGHEWTTNTFTFIPSFNKNRNKALLFADWSIFASMVFLN